MLVPARFGCSTLATSLALVQKTEANEIYNPTVQSFVRIGFELPSTPAQITGLGALNLLEAIRLQPQGPLLSDQHIRNAWQGASHSAGRRHALLSPHPLWRGQAVCALDNDGDAQRLAIMPPRPRWTCSSAARHVSRSPTTALEHLRQMMVKADLRHNHAGCSF